VLNEKKNLKKLIDKIEFHTKNLNKEIIIIVDNSQDGSYELVRSIKKKNLMVLIFYFVMQ
jgi:glycosyltransferase involved in cell wall biosynthesis